MRLAFSLYKYFPYGGLARDFVRIAKLCIEKGHSVDVYVMEWQDDLISEFNVHILSCKGWSNYAKVGDFHKRLNGKLTAENYDAVISFNKIPNVDVYYAADPCYIDRFKKKSLLQILNPRFRFYAAVEEAVFGNSSKTLCLMISDMQTALFKRHYGITDDRLVMLPPGIDSDRRKPKNADEIRKKFRVEHQFDEQNLLILMVGTGFKTKGVDRAVNALASLPDALRDKAHLIVVGEGDFASYEHSAVEKGVGNQIHFMGGRSDVPDFLLSCDMLLHPARKDNTGTVILEAMVAGLPMLVTSVCGYAKHVLKSGAGEVLNASFSEDELNEKLQIMLFSDKKEWISNALKYAEDEDLYSMPEKAVEAIERVLESRQNAD
ncbi:MAG: glucosyltransferase [Cycloclasticus sp. symbiont of Poecilosclerida sp. M]|nr:MAG: glucosyltransferase [Cycloclasticus sp. symbiont of Poecilosclerida sp. M]